MQCGRLPLAPQGYATARHSTLHTGSGDAFAALVAWGSSCGTFMNASRRLQPSAELDALETRMGELASLLSEMADALTSYPESICIVEAAADQPSGDTTAVHLSAQEWPTIQEIEQLVANWRHLREMADRS
jgi:hypothetical protein